MYVPTTVIMVHACCNVSRSNFLDLFKVVLADFRVRDLEQPVCVTIKLVKETSALCIYLT
jgi:hypothetical protein